MYIAGVNRFLVLDHPPDRVAHLTHHPEAWPGTGISRNKEQQLQQEQIFSNAKV